jgi:hypothetical protein
LVIGPRGAQECAAEQFMTLFVAGRTCGDAMVTNGHQNGHQPPSTTAGLIVAYLAENVGITGTCLTAVDGG